MAVSDQAVTVDLFLTHPGPGPVVVEHRNSNAPAAMLDAVLHMGDKVVPLEGPPVEAMMITRVIHREYLELQPETRTHFARYTYPWADGSKPADATRVVASTVIYGQLSTPYPVGPMTGWVAGKSPTT